MSDYFFSRQGKGSETTASDIYESPAEVLRFEYEIGRRVTTLYSIVGSREARACPKRRLERSSSARRRCQS
jgi:hypothetical protein